MENQKTRVILPIHGGGQKNPYLKIPNQTCRRCGGIQHHPGALTAPELEEVWIFCGRCGVGLKPFSTSSSVSFKHLTVKCPRLTDNVCFCQNWGVYM